MKNMSKFQIVFIGIFLFVSVFSLLVFADIIPLGTKKAAEQSGSGYVVVWGSVPFRTVTGAIEELNRAVKSYTVMYIEKNPDNIEQELIEALASGKGPDIILFTDDQLLRIQDKLYPLPYASYPQALFASEFATEANLLISPGGLLGLPIGIDPLVMYYNQDMFDSASIAFPPKTWTEVSEIVIPKLTKRDIVDSSKITTSAIALGAYSNVGHAKDILSALFFQTGQNIVTKDASFGFISPLSSSISNIGAVQALDFYSSFSNPSNENYSWNRSMKDSLSSFVSGSLGIYLGYASEIGNITKTNPNLHFMVAKFPQSENTNISVTIGKMYSVGILKSSKNLNTSFLAAGTMSKPEFVTTFTKAMNIAPARRDLLSTRPEDSYSGIFYESALSARGWYDPNRSATEIIFKDVIERVSRGEQKSRDAIFYMGASLTRLLQAVVPVVQ